MSGITVTPVKGCIKTHLGKGPHWVGSKQEFLYIDITEKAVLRYVPKTGECYKVKLDVPSVSFVVPVSGQPNKYLVAEGRNISILEWDGKSATPSAPIKPVFTVDDHCPTNRLNDGKCDSLGRLWAGTMGHESGLGEFDAKKGSLYSFGLDGKVKAHVDKIDISNGITWSPDNKVMYYVDSFAYRVDAFDFDAEKGELSNRRVIYDLKKHNETGIPDAMTTDTDGNIYVAIHAGAKVLKIDPRKGEKVLQIDFPTKHLDSVTFGGPNLDILYAVTAYRYLTDEEMKAQPDAGCVFEVKGLGARGVSAGYEYKGPI